MASRARKRRMIVTNKFGVVCEALCYCTYARNVFDILPFKQYRPIPIPLVKRYNIND